MKKITPNMVINEVIKEYPETLRVLSHYEIDSCCGGQHTLEEAARAKRIDIQVLVRELEAVYQGKRNEDRDLTGRKLLGRRFFPWQR